MSDVSRRNLLRGSAAVGIAGAGTALLQSKAFAAPTLVTGPAVAGAPTAQQIHLQYGGDPRTQMTVSWATPASVRRPRVRLSDQHGHVIREVPADTRSYVDGINKVETICHHGSIGGLRPGATYVYDILADGAAPVRGTMTTAPAGPAAFRFTSFGDLSTPNTAWKKSSLNAATAVHQVAAFNPLFHLHNGDLSYANDNQQSQPQVWGDFMNNIQTAAGHIPWMPALGNHETEWGNGPLGYASYQTRFALPDNGFQRQGWQGNWYSFQVGSVLFVALDANDVIYQNDGSANPDASKQGLYIRGYSGGAQQRWLEQTLRAARRDPGIDWIIPFQHQLAMSSSASGSGGDLGIREAFMPLFDVYDVDLVLCGHDHDYERTYTVHGVDHGSDWLRPQVVGTGLRTIDVTHGRVHLTLGGGGTSGHDDVYGADTVGSNPVYGGDPVAQVYTDRPADAIFKADASGSEIATWSAVRDSDTSHPWGVATFDVDPGSWHSGQTSIKVTYWHTPAATLANPFPAPTPFDSFTLTKTRSHGWG
ncbi:purple acid phosphatase family protein [Rudaeicoccus suwonensis]|uniref:Secreted protein n=1 Tax=Rudaeicoccus suwonensis TaxID=657409 RepID=A0A561EB26_9MICO|nr:metallophosphoesterase family protein [Rudaeicoccus suwonensis]TWE12823.1 secreted protein [Rudaeicoccus suwonensis]